MTVELSRMQIAILANLVEAERTSDKNNLDSLTADIGTTVLDDLASKLMDALGTDGDISLKEEYVGAADAR